MAKQVELSARKLSINSLFLIAIGATSWWAITVLAIYSDLFYDDYRYELVEEEAPLKTDEPFTYYDSIYDPVIHPSTYMNLTAILVFAMTALWARQIARRATAMQAENRLVKTASVWSFIAVIVALLLGVVFAFATFVSSLAQGTGADPAVRIFATYVPILLSAGLLLFVVLRGFVIKPEVEND